MRPATRAPVVVGIDGSDPSARALEVAVAEAARRGASVRIVHAFQLPVLVNAAPIGMVAPSPLTGTGPSDWNRKLLADARARVRRRFASRRAAARGVRRAGPGRVSASAAMVVVGSHERGQPRSWDG